MIRAPRITWCAVVSSVWFGAACGTEADADDYVPDGPAWVELGTGVDAFASASTTADIEVIFGVQGGHMVALSVRASGVDAREPRVTFAAYLETGAPAGTAVRRRDLTGVDRDTVELVGTWLLLDPTIDPAAYLGRKLRVDVELVDAAGNVAFDQGVFRAISAGD